MSVNDVRLIRDLLWVLDVQLLSRRNVLRFDQRHAHLNHLKYLDESRLCHSRYDGDVDVCVYVYVYANRQLMASC